MIYDAIINKSKLERESRVKNKKTGAYYEWHHVVPRCMGSEKNSETVILTPKEHYLCHSLLCKIYSDTVWYTKLIAAFWRMANIHINSRRYKISARTYSNLKIEHCKVMQLMHADKSSAINSEKCKLIKSNKIKALFADPNSTYNSAEYKQKIKAARNTPEYKQARKEIAIMNRAEPNSTYNSAEYLENMKAGIAKYWSTPGIHEKRSAIALEASKKHSHKLSAIQQKRWEDNPELKEKASQKFKAMWANPEFREKMCQIRNSEQYKNNCKEKKIKRNQQNI